MYRQIRQFFKLKRKEMGWHGIEATGSLASLSNQDPIKNIKN